MKHTKNILGTMLLMTAVVATSSCVDDKLLAYQVEKPASIAGMEYLNDYDALKSYVSSSANPDFKLGIALAASDYIDGGQITRLANSNFVEMTAGNAMKYASCVAEDGTMNFDAVEKFVAAAKAGGMTIYGHTLGWHAQQNNKYLNGLLADRKVEDDGSVKENYVIDMDFEDGQGFGGWGNGSTQEVVEEDGSLCIKLTNPSVTNSWSAQAAIDMPFEVGKKHNLRMKVKATDNATLKVGFQNPSNYAGCGDFPPFSVTTEWQEITLSTTTLEGAARFLFSYGDFAGSIFIDDLQVYTEESAAVEIFNEYLFEFNFEDGQILSGWGNNSTREVVDDGGTKCLKITNPSVTDFWSAQMAVDVNDHFESGMTYYMKMRIKGSSDGILRSGFQISSTFAGVGDFPNISFTSEWKDVEIHTVCTSDEANRWIFSFGDFAGDIYIDDLALFIKKEGNSIPLTSQEKKDTLTWEMNRWVEGMMKATAGYVTAWDVVNEAIAGGGDDGEGFYPLQSASNVSAEDAKKNFYWQDYLGSEDYVRITVAAARKYYAENGGTNPLKLFINDYNLESDWDDNKKAKSLVHWIEKWEADGVTKIDGIGTQMHVSCYAKEATQKSKEEHVVKMFEILAASGKLVKISELDMGYIDEDGNSVKTENMTEAQHKAMAEYYKFIVKKYFEIIPAAQQYGITQWCATDSPADSGWRGGEPVGLWNANYNRKHTYAGFADGLAGK